MSLTISCSAVIETRVKSLQCNGRQNLNGSAMITVRTLRRNAAARQEKAKLTWVAEWIAALCEDSDELLSQISPSQVNPLNRVRQRVTYDVKIISEIVWYLHVKKTSKTSKNLKVNVAFDKIMAYDDDCAVLLHAHAMEIWSHLRRWAQRVWRHRPSPARCLSFCRRRKATARLG